MPAALSQLCQVLAQGAVRGAAARLACRATRGYAAQTAEAVVEASLPAAVEATQPRMSAKMAEAFDDDKHYGANNYKAIGPVYKSGKGMYVTDIDGRTYLDCMAGFSAVNQGHAHPKIVAALSEQASKLGLVSRGLFSEAFPAYAKYITGVFGYDKVLPASTGAETGETAIKLARRWGYDVKGIPPNEARVVFAAGNFWGRTIAAVSSSTDASAHGGFGPLVPHFYNVPYDDLPALEAAICHPNVAAFMVEPVQGEAGCVVSSPGYLAAVSALCKKHNVLFIADEVQSGLGRCGAMLASHAAGARPDIVCLGKALGGGVYPVSAVLADDAVMSVIKPGQHGSTWGGNPIACAVGTASLKVLIDEELPQNAKHIGDSLMSDLRSIASDSGGILSTVRGQGLLVGIVVNTGHKGATAWDFCERMIARGVLCKPTGAKGDVIRFAPPLTMSAGQAELAADVVSKVVRSYS